MATHVRREDRRFEDLAEPRRKLAQSSKVTAEEVSKLVATEQMDEGDGVEVLEDGLVVVDLSDGSVGVDLRVAARQ